MPTWTSNKIHVSHKDPAFISRLQDAKEGLFSSFIPPGDDDSIFWRSEHWGTKWDVKMKNVVVSSDGLTLGADFRSAWGPPVNFYIHLQNMGFKVRATFAGESGESGYFDEHGIHMKEISEASNVHE